MTTPNDIIRFAAKTAGILGQGETLAAEDTNDIFTALKHMMSQWQQKRWLVYHLVTYNVTSTGATTYSVGPGQTINVPLTPRRLESAYFRQLNTGTNQVDYPLEIINAMEDYNDITLKNLETFPRYIFYDSGYPYGTLYPWPIIQATNYALFVTFKEVLQQFVNLNDVISLPLEYLAALEWNLAERVRVMYRLPEDTKLAGFAKDSLNTIRNANNQMPRLKMPRYLIRRGIYNIYSDQSY